MATAARERAEPVATRERILFAALDAFAHAGYRGATTRMIARAAGLSEITLFRLLRSKAELFAELVRRIDELLATPITLPEVPRHPHTELSAWVNDFAGRFERIAPVVRVAVAEHESHPELTDAVATQGRRALLDVAAYLERLKMAGLIDASADTAGDRGLSCSGVDLPEHPVPSGRLAHDGSESEPHMEVAAARTQTRRGRRAPVHWRSRTPATRTRGSRLPRRGAHRQGASRGAHR